MDKLSWAGEFPAVSFEDWQNAALKALKGAALHDLDCDLYEGLTSKPLYTARNGASAAAQSGHPGAAPFIRGAGQPVEGRPWTIIQFLDHLDLAEANRQLKEDIAGGVQSFWMQFGGNIAYGGAFIGARTLQAMERIFDGVSLEDIGIYISGGFDTVAGAALMASLWEKKGVFPDKVKGSAGLDPLSAIAANGQVPAERSQALADALDAATYLREKGFGLRPFLVSGRVWHQAGGSAREELAYTLAAAVSYWRGCVENGWSLEDTASGIGFALSAEADLFITIAKFRAMRALWARVIETAGLPPRAPSIIAEMSFRMITERDPHVNLLRATAAAFGAAIGGAEACLLIPFNTRHGTPDAFSRHLARNTQLILQEEAQLGRVADAAGGSWYVETLTHQLAEAAWNEFRRVEKAGGLLPALEEGLIARQITDVKMRRALNIAHNRDKITGVSSFPSLAEEPLFSRPEDLEIDLGALDDEGIVPILPPASRGKRFAAMIEAAGNGATLKGLERGCETLMERYDFVPATAERLAEPFELLRAASDKALARVKARPPVFLANLGPLAEYNSRASWAKNFYAAAGIESIDNNGFDEFEKLIRRFQRSPAPIACICASDKTLGQMSGVAAALKRGGAVAVYLAAEPGTLSILSDEDKRAVDRIIYEGCNMLKLLMELHHMMRVKELGQAEAEDFDESDDYAPGELSRA